MLALMKRMASASLALGGLALMSEMTYHIRDV